MIGTMGRLSFLQYLPRLRLWVLADPSNSYVAAFEVYTCATEGVQHGLGYLVVMKLMALYVGLSFALSQGKNSAMRNSACKQTRLT